MTKKVRTRTLPETDPEFLYALAARTESPSGTSILGDKKEVMLLIDNDIKRFTLSKSTRWLLGRFEDATDHPDQIDLSPYAARDKGVSRFHLQLQIENEQLFATDLNSMNGTYLSSDPLPANKRVLVRNGDILILGRLSIQVLFR